MICARPLNGWACCTSRCVLEMAGNGPKPGWTRVRFDQMAENVTDRVDDPRTAGVERYVGLEHLDPDSLKIRRWGVPTDVEATKLRFRKGDIIFGRRRAYQRKLAVADFDGICSAHAMVLRAKRDVVLPEFLPFFMQSDLFMQRAQDISVGSLSPTINWKTLAVQEFALPPLQEQLRVGRFLSAMQATLEATSAARSAATRLERAFLDDAFGEPDSSQRVLAKPLREVAFVQTGVAKGKASSSETSEMPYIGVGNLQDGYLDLSDVGRITVEASRIQQYLLRPGDVLMTEGGDPDKLGRGTVWQGEIANCVHQNHVFAVRAYTNCLDPWFLAALIRSRYGKQYFLGCSKRTSNLATINKKQVESLLVPIWDKESQQALIQQWDVLKAAITRLVNRERVIKQTISGFLAASVGGVD